MNDVYVSILIDELLKYWYNPEPYSNLQTWVWGDYKGYILVHPNYSWNTPILMASAILPEDKEISMGMRTIRKDVPTDIDCGLDHEDCIKRAKLWVINEVLKDVLRREVWSPEGRKMIPVLEDAIRSCLDRDVKFDVECVPFNDGFSVVFKSVLGNDFSTPIGNFSKLQTATMPKIAGLDVIGPDDPQSFMLDDISSEHMSIAIWALDVLKRASRNISHNVINGWYYVVGRDVIISFNLVKT